MGNRCDHTDTPGLEGQLEGRTQQDNPGHLPHKARPKGLYRPPKPRLA